MKIDGRCHCGYLTFEADADPETVTATCRLGLPLFDPAKARAPICDMSRIGIPQ